MHRLSLLLALVACGHPVPTVVDQLWWGGDAVEWDCDDIDNDGDGLVDGEDGDVVAAWYEDLDEDGAWDPTAPFLIDGTSTCPVNWSVYESTGGLYVSALSGAPWDCNDRDPDVYWGAPIDPGARMDGGGHADQNCDGWRD